MNQLWSAASLSRLSCVRALTAVDVKGPMVGPLIANDRGDQLRDFDDCPPARRAVELVVRKARGKPTQSPVEDARETQRPLSTS